jgi:hypothetical protein
MVLNTKLALGGLPIKSAIADALTNISSINARANRFGLYRNANIAIGRLIAGTIKSANKPPRPPALASA